MSWSEEVKTEPLIPGSRLPLLVRPARGSPELVGWAREHAPAVEQALLEHGALLMRGFQVTGEPTLASLLDALGGKPLDYVYRSTPRTSVGSGVYTATEYPPSATIPLHNENAYQRDWPMRLAFHCVVAARRGGETPLADTVRVTERLGAERLERFTARRIMYVRNYGPGLDLPWQTVFQTEDRAQVEQFCREHEIQWEWLPGERLRTRQICQATAPHPVTGQRLWLNQAHLFHISSLDPETREAMLELYAEDELPRNARYGDGGPLETQELDFIRHCFAQEQISFPWQPGDILLLDNMQVAHARNSFEGPRRILVAMSQPYSTLTTR